MRLLKTRYQMMMKSINNINLKFNHFACIQYLVLEIQFSLEFVVSLAALLMLSSFPCAVDLILAVSPAHDVVRHIFHVIWLFPRSIVVVVPTLVSSLQQDAKLATAQCCKSPMRRYIFFTLAVQKMYQHLCCSSEYCRTLVVGEL